MLFVCGWPAYGGVPVTFIYAVLEPPDDEQWQLQHGVRFRAGARLRQLEQTPGPMTADWLTATNVEAADCILPNATSLADVQSQHRPPPVVIGNLTTYTFNTADTYEVRLEHSTLEQRRS